MTWRILAILALCIWSATATAADLLVSATWSEDFESGTISGWESYPAFEDTAYDFTILPGHYHDRYKLQGYVGSGEFFYPVDLAAPTGTTTNTTYLLRSYRPNSASAQLVGATIKLNMNTSADSYITFDYWLKQISKPKAITVHMAGADGKRYTYTLPSLALESWQHASVPVSGMRAGTTAPASGLKIQALAIVASFDKGDASSYIYFCLDNVTVTGRARAGFDVTAPATQAFKLWPMLFAKRHYHPGDAVSVTAKPAATLSSASARLENFDGAVVHGPVALAQSSGQWSGTLNFATTDTPGPYMMVIEGTDSTGKTARSDVRVWCINNVAAGTHPRLWFGASDIPRLQARRTSGDGAAGWSTIGSKATQPFVYTNSINQYFPEDYLVPDQTAYNTWVSALSTPEQAIFYNAFVYAISGSSYNGTYAKDSLVKFAGWDQWNHPWFQGQGRYAYYPIGRATQSAAFAYDAVYGLFSAQERADVCRGIMKNGVIPAWTEWFRDDRVGNNTSNWIHHATAGAIEALIAMEGELTGDDAANWDIYFSGLMEKAIQLPRYTLHPDGGWGEDYSYQDYAQQGGQPMFAALKQAYGVTGLARSLNYMAGHAFPLYASFDGSRTMLPMGDSHEARSISNAWVWFAQESNDPVYRWFVNQVISSKWEDFLWRDTTLPMQSPEQAGWPRSKAFPGKGNVVFRSGWGANDIVMVYRGGANYNHTHVDQGNFIMSVANQQVLCEAGCYSYYYQDPYFWSYFTQAMGHNVVLVDGNPESQQCGDFLGDATAFQDRARIDRTVLGGPVNFLASQLEPVYRGALSEYTRRIYFVDPGCAVVFDRIKAPATHQYVWQLYPASKNALTLDGPKQATFGSVSNKVQVNVVGGSGTELRVQDMPIAIPKLMTSTPQARAALQLANTVKNTTQDYLVTLVPYTGGAPIASSISEVGGSGYRGVRLTMSDRVGTVVFAASTGQISGDIATDGPSAGVSSASGTILGAAFEQATHGSAGGKALFTSTVALSAGLDRTGTREVWTFQSPSAASVVVTMANGTQKVLSVPAGDSTFTLDNSSAAGPDGLSLQ
ncbi:MAG: heparinase II/III family protein [Candidatus Sumerlaeia bacterium]